MLNSTRKYVKLTNDIFNLTTIKCTGKEDAMALHNRLKEHRARLSINQSELGRMAGVSRQTISLIERGDYSPSVTLALKLAAICGVTVEEIFSMDKEDLYVPEDP